MLLDDANRTRLLQAARDSIAAKLDCAGFTAAALPQDPALQEIRASFVTLRLNDALRGCIGALEAVRPLLEDVRHNARAAAFHDPRFKPVAKTEFAGLRIGVSVLSPPQLLACATHAELLDKLRPGQDGLIVQDGMRRATFLPAVWESLPDAEDFVAQLMQKAGLPSHHWSVDLRCFTYAAESFEEGS